MTMLMENSPTLHTQRLTLRRFEARDAASLLTLLSDPETNTFLPWFPLQSLAEAQAFLQRSFLSFDRCPSAYRYALCLKGRDEPVGYVWLSEDESRDFGYALRKELWHQGLVTEAAQAVANRIGAAGYPSITATHDVRNMRSGSVMKKLGMTYRYSYVEQWQPKNIPVTFRMYQLDFDGGAGGTYTGYWDKYPNHFVETDV